MGTSGSKSFDVEMDTLAEETKFPYGGDPFEGLSERAKKIFQGCQDLNLQTIEGLEEKAKKLLLTCHDLNLQRFEGLEKADRLLQACQDPDLNSIQDLDENTLKKVDKNGMNIFHVLLFDKENHKGQNQEWYTKNLDTASRQKCVAFIEAICQKLPKQDIESMMIHQDNFGRTPLHYAGIIDIVDESEDSNITLALMKHGADKALFVEDKKKETPVSFIGTSNLRVHLDTKQRIEGPVGHKDQVAHCDISILQPKVEKTTKYPLNLDYLRKLAKKHRDLFDHQVISAMIWEKRKEYLWAIFFASFMKLLTLLLVLVAFGLRYGPRQEKDMSSKLFYVSFAIDFFPILINIYAVRAMRKFGWDCFFHFFYHSKRTFLLSMFYLAVGISLIIAFVIPGQINLSNQKGLAGLYCICNAYCLFRSSKDLLQPTVFESFGWFEVVFKNITKLLAVHSWLLLTFVFAFYIQFNNFEENTNQDKYCNMKFRNCTEIIPTSSNTTELRTEMFDECLDFFRNCTKTEENQFNDWKVMFKALSMSAGELTFDDLPLDDNPIYILTFAFFIVLVLFVIMNLMTSLAVNDIQEIRNQSRDGTWFKLMFTLMWYHAALPDRIKKLIIREAIEDKDVKIISFKLNDVPHLTKPSTWPYFFTRMPDSVSVKAQGNAQKGGVSTDTFSIVHNMEKFEEIVILFGTSTDYNEVILKKGKPHPRQVGFWKTKFAIVDYKDGYDVRRKMYRTQCFNVSGSTKVEIAFKAYDDTANGQFVVFDQSDPDKNIEGTIKQYVDAKPTKQAVDAIEKYKIT